MRLALFNPYYLLCAFIVVFFLLSACGTSNELEQKKHADLETIFWDRIQESRTHFTEADVEFMSKMIGHHAQALVLSSLAPENTNNKEIQVLAARIINAQNDEITFMQQWLRDRNQIVPEIHIDGLKLTVRGGAHSGDHRDMPGMLSDQQLQRLANSYNSEFDQLFLRYMIEHHKGAIVMVEELFAVDGVGNDEESFRLAADIHVDQITEIERMQLMLRQMEQRSSSTN